MDMTGIIVKGGDRTLTIIRGNIFMAKKRVLIVDDAKDILFLLTHSVKRLGPDYEVSTAMDGLTALEQVRKQRFDLLITDHMMPGMTGLQLAREVRQISPETRIVLMTAYDSNSLRDMVDDLDLGGFVGKPFNVPQVIDMIERIVTNANNVNGVVEGVEDATTTNQAVYDHLKTLHSKTGVHYVLLLNSQGQPLQLVGKAEYAEVSRLASFVAANFLAVTEFASLLGDNTSVFKSSYHEGNKYNIYAYDVNGEFLLAVVFGMGCKPGTVWFYTKQTVAALVPLLGDVTDTIAADDLSAAAEQFDDLLGDEENSFE
jgi:two-component system response regulator (stage 0 sporulation protein F)